MIKAAVRIATQGIVPLQANYAKPDVVYSIFDLLSTASAQAADEPTVKSAQQLLLEALQGDQQGAALHAQNAADVQPWCSFPDKQDDGMVPTSSHQQPQQAGLIASACPNKHIQAFPVDFSSIQVG